MATFASTSLALGVENLETDFAHRKTAYFQHFKTCLLNFSKMILFTADNIPSKHLQDLRLQLRASENPLQRSLIVMGKNTLMRRVVKSLASSDDSHSSLAKLLPLIEGKIGFVFTNTEDPLSIARLLSQQVTTTSAKPGSLSPCDVVLQGQTNLSPDKTSFFRAVGINTRISKNQVELLTPITVLKKGERVTASQSALLELLKIRPFEYRLHVKAIFEAGEVSEWSKLGDDISSLLLKSEAETQANVEDLVKRSVGHILGLSSSLSMASELIPASLLALYKSTAPVTAGTTTTSTSVTDTSAQVNDAQGDDDDGEKEDNLDMMDLFGAGLEDEGDDAPKIVKEVKEGDESEEIVSAGGFGSLFGDEED